MDYKKITHLLSGYIFRAKPSGLVRSPEDSRDLKTENLGWSLFGYYTPKHQSYTIKTLSVKSQNFNDCQWNATTVQKEPDEQILLSPGSIVSYGKQNGMVSGDGFSNLRDGQKVLKDWGVVEDALVNPIYEDFERYASLDIVKFKAKAEKHKTSSYWSVSSRGDILKLLDEDKILTTGIEWFGGFNQGGGFDAPWIIEKPVGYKVGGHAIVIIGYNLNYFGRKVYIMQNSYGKGWGNEGKFYIEMNYLEKNHYGIWTNSDMSVDTGKFINEFDGKNVKTKNSPTIFCIQQAKKKPYLHEMDYFVYNVNDPLMENFYIVDEEILSKIETGDPMDITKSLYWNALKHLDQPLNIVRILEAIKETKIN